MTPKIYTCPLCGRKFTESEAKTGPEKYQCPRCFVELDFDREKFREKEKE